MYTIWNGGIRIHLYSIEYQIKISKKKQNVFYKLSFYIRLKHSNPYIPSYARREMECGVTAARVSYGQKLPCEPAKEETRERVDNKPRTQQIEGHFFYVFVLLSEHTCVWWDCGHCRICGARGSRKLGGPAGIIIVTNYEESTRNRLAVSKAPPTRSKRAAAPFAVSARTRWDERKKKKSRLPRATATATRRRRACTRRHTRTGKGGGGGK